jgi:hypothetical protein
MRNLRERIHRLSAPRTFVVLLFAKLIAGANARATPERNAAICIRYTTVTPHCGVRAAPFATLIENTSPATVAPRNWLRLLSYVRTFHAAGDQRST